MADYKGEACGGEATTLDAVGGAEPGEGFLDDSDRNSANLNPIEDDLSDKTVDIGAGSHRVGDR